jgi:RNA polymerase sigma-70 factor (ECF subfamily)
MVAEDSAGWLSEALAGDARALNRLIAALTPVVQARVARALLARRALRAGGRNMRQDVEDLTQEIWIALFSNGARVLRSWQAERGLSLENFVGLVSERHVASFLRSGRRNPRREELATGEEIEATTDAPGPEEITAGREQLRLLLDRLQGALSRWAVRFSTSSSCASSRCRGDRRERPVGRRLVRLAEPDPQTGQRSAARIVKNSDRPAKH